MITISIILFIEPSGSPIDIQARNITSTSITFSWSPPVPLDANGIITGYLLNLTRNGVIRTHLLSISSYTEAGTLNLLHNMI